MLLPLSYKRAFSQIANKDIMSSSFQTIVLVSQQYRKTKQDVQKTLIAHGQAYLHAQSAAIQTAISVAETLVQQQHMAAYSKITSALLVNKQGHKMAKVVIGLSYLQPAGQPRNQRNEKVRYRQVAVAGQDRPEDQKSRGNRFREQDGKPRKQYRKREPDSPSHKNE